MNEKLNMEDVVSVKYRFPTIVGDRFVEYYMDGRNSLRKDSPQHLKKQADIVIETGLEAFFKFQEDGLQIHSFSISDKRFSFKFDDRFYFGIVQKEGFQFLCDAWNVSIRLND